MRVFTVRCCVDGGNRRAMVRGRDGPLERVDASSGKKQSAEEKRRARNHAMSSPKASVGGNPIHRRLKYHEQKLLRKHDFMQYPQDMWHEPFCIKKYHLTDREDYRRYFKLVGLIRALMSHLRFLPAESRVRIQVTEQLIGKLYDMGLLQERLGLAEVDKVGVEAFCKRRLPSILVGLKMAPNCQIASQYIEHGHVKVALNQVRDPAFLVPRTLDDQVTWLNRSAIKGHVRQFNAAQDDFDITN